MNQRNSSTTWALLLGCLCFVAGGTLAVSKYIDPAFGEYAGAIGRAMANGGTLGLFGLVLIAVYTSTNSSSASNSSKESGEAYKSSGADQSLVLEQLAGDMAQVRAQLEMLQKTQQADHSDAAKQENGQLNSDDRLFRLAAGIDQLGARVDSRLKTQHGATMDAIDGLGREVQALLDRVAELEANTSCGFERISNSLAHSSTTAGTTECTATTQETCDAGAGSFEWAANCGLPDGDCTSDEGDLYDCGAGTSSSCDTDQDGATTNTCETTDCGQETTSDQGVWCMPTVERTTAACEPQAPVWTMDEPVVSEDFVGAVEAPACGTQDGTDGDPYAATPEPEIELVQGFQGSDDDFEVSVELEPETCATTGGDTGSLGILDTIDAPQAALPQAPEQDATNAKLAALMELMGDPAVRKALESLQRGQ